MNKNTSQEPARRLSRRQVFRSSGAAAALALGGSLTACAQSDEAADHQAKSPLQRGDRVPLESTPEEIIQATYELVYQYEKKYGG